MLGLPILLGHRVLLRLLHVLLLIILVWCTSGVPKLLLLLMVHWLSDFLLLTSLPLLGILIPGLPSSCTVCTRESRCRWCIRVVELLWLIRALLLLSRVLVTCLLSRVKLWRHRIGLTLVLHELLRLALRELPLL